MRDTHKIEILKQTTTSCSWAKGGLAVSLIYKEIRHLLDTDLLNPLIAFCEIHFERAEKKIIRTKCYKRSGPYNMFLIDITSVNTDSG